MMTDLYKVPKIERVIEVKLDGDKGEPKTYTVFLNCMSRFGFGEETIEEYLREAVDFFGVKNIENDKFSIINHRAIVYVRATEEFQHEVSKKLKIMLAGGGEIEVYDYIVRPSQHSRILDYLNSGEQFLPFLYENRKIYVNRDKILSVEVQ